MTDQLDLQDKERQYGLLADRLRERIRTDRDSTPISVMVMGPGKGNTESPDAANLRGFIVRRCWEIGATIPNKPEHQSLVEIAKQERGEWTDLCSYEIDLANESDLIVLIPASAGSLVELGLFSLEIDIPTKMIVLFDKKHRRKKSFVMNGPRQALENRRAIIKFVDYVDRQSTWQFLQEQIELRRSLIIQRRSEIRSNRRIENL